MSPHYSIPATPQQAATWLHDQLRAFLAPLLTHLDRQLDRRLVQTVTATITATLTFRHRAAGLLLSELGAFILSPAHAPAGTKRLSNLLRSPRWAAATVQTWLWIQSAQQIAMLHARGETPLLVWDTSVLESAESPRLPDLCPVRSASACLLCARRCWSCVPSPGSPASAGATLIGIAALRLPMNRSLCLHRRISHDRTPRSSALLRQICHSWHAE